MSETGWLIELPLTGKNGGRLCWVTLEDKRLDRFRTVREGEDYEFQRREFPLKYTPDSNQALRFARKEDAELFMRVFDYFLLHAVATEHKWMVP